MASDSIDRPDSALVRVHVVGGPGSGKTTLARQLGDLLGLPVFELDEIAEQEGIAPGFQLNCSLRTRLADVYAVSDRPGWVTEGSYLWWTDPLLDAADVVVWLDVPWYAGIGRVLWRHLGEYVRRPVRSRSIGGVLLSLRHPHVLPLLRFLEYTWRYYHGPAHGAEAAGTEMADTTVLTRAATARHLQQYVDKVICVSGSAAPESLAAAVGTLTSQRALALQPPARIAART